MKIELFRFFKNGTILSSSSLLLDTIPDCCWVLLVDELPSFLPLGIFAGFAKSKKNPNINPIMRPGMKFSGLKLTPNNSFCCCSLTREN